MPQIRVGQLYLVADECAGPDSLLAREAIDPKGVLHVAHGSDGGQLVDGTGRHEGLHELTFHRTGHGAGEVVDGSLDGDVVGGEHFDRDERVAPACEPTGQRTIDFDTKLRIGTRAAAR